MSAFKRLLVVLWIAHVLAGVRAVQYLRRNLV
jgi:hypothetical protein